MKFKGRIILILAVFGLLFFLNLTRLGLGIRAKTLQLISPGLNQFSKIGKSSRDKISLLFTASNLKEDNKKLRDKVIQLEQEIISLQNKNNDFQALINAEALGKSKNFDLIPARIITRTFTNIGLTFVINKGKTSGIDAGKIAITDQGVLIGKIISAEDDYSILRLVTDESSKFTAAISGSSKVIGETRGKLGAEIELRLIPRDVEINKDDLIITAGLEDAPSGLLVGRVAEVFGDPQNSLKQALVAPAFNQDDLDNIFIIKNY